jgi:H+/gluconate symporter-like permease
MMEQIWLGLVVGVLGVIYAGVMLMVVFEKKFKDGISFFTGILIGSPLLITWWNMLMGDKVIAVFISIVVMYWIFMWLKGRKS